MTKKLGVEQVRVTVFPLQPRSRGERSNLSGALRLLHLWKRGLSMRMYTCAFHLHRSMATRDHRHNMNMKVSSRPAGGTSVKIDPTNRAGNSRFSDTSKVTFFRLCTETLLGRA